MRPAMMLAALCGVAMILATVAGAGTPKTFSKTFFINCGAVTTKASAQLCPRPPNTYTLGTIKVASPVVTLSYVTSGHCSTVDLFVYVDGRKTAQTGKIGASGAGKVIFKVANHKTHKLSFVEQGFVGGCNSGELISIAGTITISYTH